VQCDSTARRRACTSPIKSSDSLRRAMPGEDNTMSTEEFRTEARALMERLLFDAQTNTDRAALLDSYAEEITRLHRDILKRR
jgi:hypothetical protein